MSSCSRPLLALSLAAALISALATGCGDSAPKPTKPAPTKGRQIQHDPANESVAIKVGAKTSTEQELLAEIYSQAFAAAGFRSSVEADLGDSIDTFSALENGSIDAYAEYLTTALVQLVKTRRDQVPGDTNEAHDFLDNELDRLGISVLPAAPFENSRGLAITPELSAQLGITRISELRDQAPQLTVAGPPDCKTDKYCLPLLRDAYSLQFKRYVLAKQDSSYNRLRDGSADVALVRTSDPEIADRRLILLEDDRNAFPPLNAALLVRDSTLAKAGPDLELLAEELRPFLTNSTLQKLSAAVEFGHKSPRSVAHQFLVRLGFLAQ